jgi:hypothetical protein
VHDAAKPWLLRHELTRCLSLTAARRITWQHIVQVSRGICACSLPQKRQPVPHARRVAHAPWPRSMAITTPGVSHTPSATGTYALNSASVAQRWPGEWRARVHPSRMPRSSGNVQTCSPDPGPLPKRCSLLRSVCHAATVHTSRSMRQPQTPTVSVAGEGAAPTTRLTQPAVELCADTWPTPRHPAPIPPPPATTQAIHSDTLNNLSL